MPGWLRSDSAAPPLTFPFRSNRKVCFIERYYLFITILTSVEGLKTYKEIRVVMTPNTGSPLPYLQKLEVL